MSTYKTDDGLEVIDPYADAECDEEQENLCVTALPPAVSSFQQARPESNAQGTVLTDITNVVGSPSHHKREVAISKPSVITVTKQKKHDAFACLMQASAATNSKKRTAASLNNNTLAVPTKKRATLSPGISQKPKSEQLYLDAGQRDLGATRCATCGLTYFKGEPSDEQMHANVHKPYVEGITFSNSLVQQSMIVQQNGDDSRILRITAAGASANDAVHAKVTEILTMANAELGGAHDSDSLDDEQTLFAHVKQHKVYGMIIVSRPAAAVGILSSAADTTATALTDAASDCNAATNSPCDTQSHRLLGVDKMWTHVKFRRNGVAAALIDAARQHLVYGCTFTRQQVAFSHPTRAGRVFAEKYSGQQNFLTYS